MKEKWETEFDEEFKLLENDYQLMQQRGVHGGREQLKKIKDFIKENFISKKELQEVLSGMERESEKYVPFQKIHYQSALKEIKEKLCK